MDSVPRHPGATTAPGGRWRDSLAVWPQYLLPHHAISRLIHAITRSRRGWLKDRLIRWFIRRYGVDMAEAREPRPEAYASFNAFFTRALKPESRPIVSGRGEFACPVDGRVSQCGPIEGDRIFQAKGHYYSLQALLGGDAQDAQAFFGGSFATLYLSPRDYHRIHMPASARLRAMAHVPGRLFSVNPATTQRVPGLFARNERVVTWFDTEVGPMALVLVGAINVASIETVWAGEVTPPAGTRLRRWDYGGEAQPLLLERGQEMGRFNMGSTVVVLFSADAVSWAPELRSGAVVRMGQLLARSTA